LLPGLAWAAPAAAQVELDATLGAAGPVTGPDFRVAAGLGRQVGGNLFHSFKTFNLAAGESATFSGPSSVARVIARVTGGSPSSIDGTLRCTIPDADFYFMNPAGVVFGPNASLDSKAPSPSRPLTLSTSRTAGGSTPASPPTTC
jgi:filamentous hemagglutinin family protein